MIAKVIAWNTDRKQALRILDRALAETVLLAVKTNVEYLRLLIADEDFVHPFWPDAGHS